MKISELREWNSNGLLQAAIDGNLQVKIKNDWIERDWFDVENCYNIDMNYEYRIKPKFQIGDLVRLKNNQYNLYCVVETEILDFPKAIGVEKNGFKFFFTEDEIVKVRKVLKPHTFETAVKDCAENGFDLKYGNNAYDTFKITNLLDSLFYIEGKLSPVRYTDFKEYKFHNGKPFCQVEYEECI
jgi:hypothetical protein